MADSKNIIAQTVKEEGGYQNDPADSGNFLNGINYGTKYGITPGAWSRYYGTKLQPDTIRNLSVSDAVPIYKKNYWNAFKGDQIENDSVAALMMFAVVNSGPGQVLVFKKLMNAVAGKKIVAETSTAFTNAEADLLNGLDQELFFTALKAAREQFYKNLVAQKPQLQKYLKGWLNRLDKYQFVTEKKNP